MVTGLIAIWVIIAAVFYVLKAARVVVPYIPKVLAVLICLPGVLSLVHGNGATRRK